MKLFPILLILMITTSCWKETSYEKILSAYAHANEPVNFSPELSLKGNTYKGCFSPDYSTFYFFRHKTPNAEDYRIYESTFMNGQWDEPKEVSFSGSGSDLYPLVLPSEPDKLLFLSYRRIPGDTSKKPNSNFWMSEKTNENWNEPRPFTPANLIYNYNSQPCVVQDGSIYFTSNTPDWSKTLTYVMNRDDGVYQSPILFSPVNLFRERDTTKTIFEVCISPDQTFMVLTISENRQPAKLFISYATQERWTIPKYIGDIIKADMSGNFPYITPDGKFLIFTKEFSGFYIIPTKSFVQTENLH